MQTHRKCKPKDMSSIWKCKLPNICDNIRKASYFTIWKAWKEPCFEQENESLWGNSMHFSFWSIYTYYILPLTCSSILLHSLPRRWSDWDLLGEYNFLQGMDLNTGFLTKRYMNMMRVEWLLVLNCVIWGFFCVCLPHLVGVLKRLVSTQLLDCGCTNLTKSLHPNYGIHLNLFLNFTHKK